MPRGGKRAGSGRKKGAATRKTREVADRISADGGVTPLDIMNEVMRDAFAGKKITAARKLAVQIAIKAAPYVHNRLSAITHRGDSEAPIRLVEELVVTDGGNADT